MEMETLHIGHDEWVSEVSTRRTWQRDPWGWLLDTLERINPLLLVGGLVGLAALLPLLTDSMYMVRVAGMVCIFAMLALGLHLSVGAAGMLNLGYVAFFGVGGYTYALLSSDHLGMHLPTLVSVPIVVLVSALLGLLLGLPALRLSGDYLGIVTLGFTQIFVLLAINLDRVTLPWSDEQVSLTGGPNGITGIAPWSLGGWQPAGQQEWFYLLLAVLGLIFLICWSLDHSPIGRGWRAVREDDLAAAAMGMGVGRLKLLAFVIGAVIAGVCGSLFAAWQGAIFPPHFDLNVLLMLYAMLVLGGLGSLLGMLVGALLLVGVPELLRDPETARVLFYGGVLVMLLRLRPRWHALALLSAVIVGGALFKLLAGWLWPGAIGPPLETGGLAGLVQGWLLIPPDPTLVGNILFIVVVGLLMLVSRVQPGPLRLTLLGPTLYILALVWETRLVVEPGVTRQLLLGALLVLLLMYRPQGLLGRPRVEVL
jgi:branched-chain amino acid transport system permease protein